MGTTDRVLKAGMAAQRRGIMREDTDRIETGDVFVTGGNAIQLVNKAEAPALHAG